MSTPGHKDGPDFEGDIFDENTNMFNKDSFGEFTSKKFKELLKQENMS